MVHFAPPLLSRSCGCTFTAEKHALSLSSPCGWVHLKLPKWVKSQLALTLAAFLHEGHFVRHIRQMRQLYQERQVTLVELARETLAGKLDVQPAAAGMHLIGWLPGKQDDRQVARAAARVWVDVSPLSLYALEGSERPGILLGYTAVGTEEMRAGLQRLASVLVTPR